MIHIIFTLNTQGDDSLCLVLKRRKAFYTLMNTLYYYYLYITKYAYNNK